LFLLVTLVMCGCGSGAHSATNVATRRAAAPARLPPRSLQRAIDMLAANAYCVEEVAWSPDGRRLMVLNDIDDTAQALDVSALHP